MKKINTTTKHLSVLKILLLAWSVIIFGSCYKKDNPITESAVDSKDVATIKTWLDDQKTGLVESKKSWLDSLSNNLDYNAGLEAEISKGRTMILIPIRITVTQEIKSENILEASQNTSSYLVLLRREGYSLSGNIIRLDNQLTQSSFNSSANIILSIMNSSNGIPEDFSGVMTDLSITKDLYYQNKYQNGKLKTAAKLNTKENLNETVRQINTGINNSAPLPNCTNWYWVTTYYDASGNVTGETSRYLYTTCDGSDSGNSYPGGGSGHSGPDDCNTTEANNFNLESTQGHTTSESLGFGYSSIDAITKHKDPVWKCFNGWGGWSLNSHEIGIVKMLNTSSNQFSWVWKSLTHASITMEGGTLAGTAVTFSQGIGTPSFTPEMAATHNIYSAGMSLSFNVTYSPISDCKTIQILLTPVSKDYTSTVIFGNANPAEP